MSLDDLVGELRSGMTVGIGGWGSRRKPMALVRAILRSDLTDLTVVSYGGPDVGLLAAAGKIKHLVTAFVTLDSIPLEPHFRAARESGALQLTVLEILDRKVRVYGATAVVTSMAELTGSKSDEEMTGRYRYTRVYVRNPQGQWKIVSFEASRIQESADHK